MIAEEVLREVMQRTARSKTYDAKKVEWGSGEYEGVSPKPFVMVRHLKEPSIGNVMANQNHG